MSQEAALRIVASVYGTESISQLQTTLENLRASTLKYNDAKKLMTAQTGVEIQTMKMSNTMLKAKANMNQGQLTQLAKQSVLEENYTQQYEMRMRREMEAYRINQAMKESGAGANIKYARYLAEESIILADAEAVKAKAFYETRRAMMSASISMFVLNITMQQLVTSLKPFVKGNKDAEVALKNVASALQFSMSPLQMYMSLQMISIGLSQKQKVAFLGVASALGAVFFLYSAITAKGAGMRAMYASLAVALFAVTIAQWMLNAALATGKALVLGDFKAFAVLAAGAAIGAGVIAGLTAPKAQTLTGHRKRVRKGGMAELDDDEVVQRISKDGSKNGGGGNINIYLPEGYNGSMADAKITAHSVKRAMNSGYGSIKYQRKVVTGG